MQDNDKEKKQPIDMTTDEAIDYLFAPEIADQLRREAGKIEEPDDSDSEKDC